MFTLLASRPDVHAGDEHVAAFALTRRHLAPGLQRPFRGLGLHAGADFDVYAAAALDGATPEQTRARLNRLFGLHLAHATTSPKRVSVTTSVSCGS